MIFLINDFWFRLEKPIFNCSHCGNEYNLKDRVPKITQCNRIVCLACLKSATKSANQLNYICQFHLEEHQIPSNGGFESLPNPIKLNKQIELNQLKIKIASFEENLQPNKVKLQIDLQIERIIESIKAMQIEMHNKLGTFENSSNCVENKTKNVWEIFHKIESDIEEIDKTNISSQRLQELNKSNIKKLLLDFEKLESETKKIKFEKSGKIFTCEELIGTLTHPNENKGLDSRNSTLPNDLNWRPILTQAKISSDITSFCLFTATNHLVLTSYDELHLFDATSFDFIKSVKLDSRLTGICQLSDVEQLCVVDKKNQCLYLIDKSYEKIKSKDRLIACGYKDNHHWDIDYNLSNGLLYLCYLCSGCMCGRKISIYILNKNLDITYQAELGSSVSLVTSIRVKKELVFALTEHNISIFDSIQLKHLISIGDKILQFPTDILISNYHIYVFEQNKSILKVFNLSNYKLNDEFKIELSNNKTKKAVLSGKNLVTISNNAEIFVHEIQVYQP